MALYVSLSNSLALLWSLPLEYPFGLMYNNGDEIKSDILKGLRNLDSAMKTEIKNWYNLNYNPDKVYRPLKEFLNEFN